MSEDASGPARGLSEAEASRRLAKEGPNALPDPQRRTLLRLVLGVAREPMFLLLLAATLLYLVLGGVGEAAILGASIVVVMTITIVQEGRTERALEALRDLTSPRALVIREGLVRSLPAREVVRGDFVRVAEGDRVPADAILREGTVVRVDESLLTGESVPVDRSPSTASQLGAPGSAVSGALFSGTLVVAGRGVAEVVATGERSELGRIGTALRATPEPPTALAREVRRATRAMAILAVAGAFSLAGLRWLATHDVVESLLSGITLAMSLLPEELPVVLTVFLAIGASRLSRIGVLTRRVAAVETLGSVHVLATDKTGTLTENRMTIRRLVVEGTDLDVDEKATALPEAVHALVEHAILASPRDPFDPMEKAFHALGDRTLAATEHLHPRWAPEREYPLTPELLAVTHVWRRDDGEELVAATKGAPVAVFDLCHLEGEVLERWRALADRLAGDGLRVLGVARATQPVGSPPPRAHDVPFTMLGLVGLADPIRPDVPAAVATARRAGIRVLMITGDHPRTAAAIAGQAGLAEGEVLLGSALDALDDAALGEALASARAVARATPAHKLRIVRALKARGEVVGMTGDGVNDAPALRAADIGVAMGKRGTDVAREAAGLVLVDDDFGAIVQAVQLGRRIWDNLQRAVSYIVGVHVPIAGMALAPALFGWDPVLTPAHVVLLELIIDPACSIVFELEPAAADVMHRPPRGRDARLFEPADTGLAVLSGLVVLAAALVVLVRGEVLGIAEAARPMASFVALVAGNVAMLLVERPRRGAPLLHPPSRGMVVLVLSASLVVGTLATVPAAARVLGSAVSLGALELVVSAVAGFVPVLLFASLVRLFARRRAR